MSRGPVMPEDYGGSPMAPRRSGIVTAVAVINFVWGGLNLVCGGLGTVTMGTLLSLLGQGKKVEVSGTALTPEQQQAIDKLKEAGGLAQILVAWGTVLALGLLITAVLEIAGGVGLIQRAAWGRIMSLIAGALLAAYTLFFLVNFDLCAFLYFVFPAVFTLIVLLLPGPARDFNPRP